jgi:hypothetical protein
MKRMTIATVLVLLIVLLSVIPAWAQDDEVRSYYVDLNYNPTNELCEDGSMQCPYNSPDEAIDQGYAEVCEGQQFYVYVKSNSDYPTIPRAYWGRKPVPGTGLPLARVAQVVLIALVGLILLVLAVRLQRRRVTQ